MAERSSGSTWIFRPSTRSIARKGRVPVVNIVGDHATTHARHDAPLQSDIETVARNVSTWVRTSQSTAALCRDTAEAIVTAMGPPGQVATLILPADVSWGEGGVPASLPQVAPPPCSSDDTIAKIAGLLQAGGRNALLLGGRALREPALVAAVKVADRPASSPRTRSARPSVTCCRTTPSSSTKRRPRA